MSIFRPPVSDYARRVSGDAPVRKLPTVTRETTGFSDLEAVVRGQVSVTRLLVNVFSDGEIFTTQKNDIVIVKQRRTSDYESRDEQIITVETGTGYLAPVAAPAPVEVEQPVESETVDSYDPTVAAEQSTYIDTNPLNQPPPPVESAPVEDVYIDPNYAANVQAQYGESYVDNYTAPVYVDPYIANTQAQYGESYTDSYAASTDYYDQQQSNLSAAYDGV